MYDVLEIGMLCTALQLKGMEEIPLISGPKRINKENGFHF